MIVTFVVDPSKHSRRVGMHWDVMWESMRVGVVQYVHEYMHGVYRLYHSDDPHNPMQGFIKITHDWEPIPTEEVNKRIEEALAKVCEFHGWEIAT